MMEFIMLTISITVAMLLASGITLLIVMNKKVLTWYMKYINKMAEEITEKMFEEEDEL